MKFRPLVLLLVCSVSALTGCVTTMIADQLNLGVEIGKPFVIQKTPCQMEWGYCTHPYMADYGPMGIMVGFNTAGEASVKPEFAAALREAGPALSLDRGTNWIRGPGSIRAANSPFQTWVGVNSIRTGNRYIIYEPAGLFSGTTHALQYAVLQEGAWLATSQTARIRGVPATKRAMYFSNKGVTLSSGELMLCAFTHFTADTHASSVLICSTNGGVDWEFRSTIATIKECPWGLEGPCEPAICTLQNGDILAVMRTGGGGESGTSSGTSMLSAVSSDGGRTWTYKRLGFPGVMPKLLRLSNGSLALAYGRPGNNLRISRDEGRSWGGEISFTGYGEPTSGYCDIAETEPGKLLVVYDRMNYITQTLWLWDPPPALNYIYGAFVTIR